MNTNMMADITADMGEPNASEATAGAATMSEAATAMVGAILVALRRVIDPELGHNILDLGLIYDVVIDGDHVRIVMTTTTPGCPATAYLRQGVERGVSAIPGIASLDVVMTYDPPWTPERIIPELRSSLGVTRRRR